MIVNPCNELLLRIAQADAFAYAAEYVDAQSSVIDECLKFERFVKHPKRLEHVPGEYTDDTQMSIAVVESLLEHDRPSQLDFAESFVRCFKRDQRSIYAGGLQWVLESVGSGLELTTNLCSDSDRNGAAMRSVPLGAINDLDKMFELAEVQASVTHNTPGGIASSMLVALMSRFSLQETTPLSELNDYLLTHLCKMPCDVKRFIESPHALRVAGQELGLKTASAALHVVSTESGLVNMLRRVIEIGGDTDTLAAIVWGVAAPRFTHDPIPGFLETGVGGNSTYGREFLVGLGGQLMNGAI